MAPHILPTVALLVGLSCTATKASAQIDTLPLTAAQLLEIKAMLYQGVYDRVGQPIPAFSLTTSAGRHIERSDLLGKRSLLFFWTVDHQPALDLLPVVNAVAAQVGDRCNVLSLTHNDADIVRYYLKTYDLSTEWIADAKAVADEFGGLGFSTFLVVDESGLLKAVYGGTEIKNLGSEEALVARLIEELSE